MTKSSCNPMLGCCTVVFCLCTTHLVLSLIYTWYSKESLTFAIGSQGILAKAASFFSSQTNGNGTSNLGQDTNGSLGENGTEPASGLGMCPETPPRLVGPLRIEFSNAVSLELIQKENPEIQDGGRWRPQDCIASQKVAIIIPYRHRESHLKYWLYYMHPILQRQQLDYGIYIINQYGETTFNRGKLMNVGYTESKKQYDYGCFVFSDVDIVPMDDRNFYKCYSQPRHLSVAVDKFGFRLPYAQIFGGVTALSTYQFERINGFPNNYWGWGGEDDDVAKRLKFRGMSISRPDSNTGRCRMIKHKMEDNNQPNPKRFDNLARTAKTIRTDGLNSLRYRVVSIEKNPLYTNITVDIGTE